MTPAIQTAKRAKIYYCVHEYIHTLHSESYGMEAAEALGVDPRLIFKTLLLSLHGRRDKFGIGIVSVVKQLDLKAFAAAFRSKKATMAEAKEAERISGYVVGGISPLGQKKALQTIVDLSALEYETIYISAGRRGLEIQLDPRDLLRLCNARVTNISRK